MRLAKVDELAFLQEITAKVLTENLAQLSMGTMLFHEAGVLVTDDIEQEFVSEDKPETIVETEYAQELSWLLRKLKDGLADTYSEYRREEFFGFLADAALSCIRRSDDRTALLLAVLMEASMMVSRSRQQRCDVLRDEVLSCAAGLTDLAEKL